MLAWPFVPGGALKPSLWQFFIDVGGTFTDVVARRPDGGLLTHKLLSSGAVRGVVGDESTETCICDHRRLGEPKDFWVGYHLAAFETLEGTNSHPNVGEQGGASARVIGSDGITGQLVLDTPLGCLAAGNVAYQLHSHEEAPVLAIRYLMGLGLEDPVGAIDVRLGTTRATNALLERTGPDVALVTTLGFADILRIGNQDRPALFALNIRKRDELATSVVEVDERLSAAGEVLRAPNERKVRRQLEQLRASGIEAVAICLLHSFVNPIHEEWIGRIAESVGFPNISISSRVARMEKLVPRGDTTVVDAYLAGVVKEYVHRLRRSLPDARLKLMTSNGGLVDADSVAGKDTILSGPAGGVIGCRHIARQAGFLKAIGFDMGGTSTDVSRIDAPPHELEYQHETVKAGVRIMAPMLAVETVAAGGGSICAFDGQKLIVGPKSAGADPGPACYGRGGPLTVTDMNVFLGRVVAEHFPFQLDRATVDHKLSRLCEQVNAATSSPLQPADLAEGFVKIANAHMAVAIKRISLAKGFDVREYVLTTFGGAGGQHACAVARTLGMSSVLCSPFSGVLSAVGIGVADVKRIGQRSVSESLDPAAICALEPVFASITSGLQDALTADGVPTASRRPPMRTLDLCYAGQTSLITVPAEPFDELRDRFETIHRRLYGYCHKGRAIRIKVVRVELIVPSQQLDTSIEPTENLVKDTTPRTTRMVIEGVEREVPLYLHEELPAGQRIDGPAIIIEKTSTIVVDSDWRVVVREQGAIVLAFEAPAVERETILAEVDPIVLELFNNQFASIAEQMGTTLRRTALSVNVRERLDFSCAIFNPQGDLVVNAPHIPVHLGGMSYCVKALAEDVGVFAPGDVYITNDPYRGGSHLNDVTVITPVHDHQGKALLFIVASRAHHAEIGGTRPGSMPPDSRSLAEEGVVIRAFRWIVNGVPQQEQLRSLLTAPPHPSRTPDENLADIAAQVAANQTGVRELKAMITRYSLGVVHGYMGYIQDAAERKMRAALAKMPDGIRKFEDRLDDGSCIRLSVDIQGEEATLDFSGSAGVIDGNLNANRSIVCSAVLYCLRCLIDEEIPLNAGVLAPITIKIPPGLLNPPGADDPRQCPAVVGGNVETSQRIVDCVFGALSTVAASQGTMNNLLMGNESFGYYETICGGAGAGPGFGGSDAVHTHMTNTRLTDPEVLEGSVPVRLIRFAIRRGSGGNGQYRGGCGVVRELEFLARLEVSILSQRRSIGPYGLCGGESGTPGRNLLLRCGKHQMDVLPSIASFTAQPGDRLTIETPGGGGWGDPSEPRP